MADIGTLTPEQMLQQQQILRQQKMAEMLMQQGMQQPQSQMVSGRYVAPSIFQNLAGLANTYVGQQGIKEAEQAQLDLAKAIRGQEGVALADYMSQLQGKPAVPEKVTELAGPYTKNVPMPTATIAGTPAVESNPMLANMNALQNPNAPAFLRQFAMSEIVKKPKWEKAEYTDPKTGVTRQGVIDVNSSNPISTFQVGGTKPEMSAHDKAMLGISLARARDEGIIGYGAPSGGQPTGVPMGMPQGQPVNMPMGQPQGMPQTTIQNQSTLMPPVNVAGLSPKAAREAQAEQAKTYQENVKNAYEVAKIFPAIEKALPNAHGSGIGNIMGGVANFVGYESSQNAADAELKVMSDKLLKAVPRFSGPQSDKDVASYKEAAGSIGDASLPMNVRMAALNTIKELNKPYAPNLNWNSQAPTSSAKVVDFNSLPTGKR